MSNCELLKSDFEKFLLFQCENKAINPDDLIGSTIHLLHNCVSARCAILQFYGQLLDELSLLHVHDQRLQAIDSTHLLYRLLHYQDPDSPVKPKKSADFATAPGATSTASSSNKDTPLSPPLQTDTCDPVSLGTKNENLTDTPDVSLVLDKIINAISTTLRELMQEPGCDTRELIVEWCIELLATLPAKYNTTSMFAGLNPNACLAKQITFWTECKALRTLLELVIESVKALPNSHEHTQLVMNNLLRYSPNSNWVCAHLLTALPENENHLLKACIDAFLKNSAQNSTASASGTAIFSFVSEKSPKAIINSLKHNIPVLLKLSFTSKPLLELLAIEAVKEVNIQFLNSLQNTVNEDLKEYALYCILNAPNAFDLLRLVFVSCVADEASDRVKQEAECLAELVLGKLHEKVYLSSVVHKLNLTTVLKQHLTPLVFLFVETKQKNDHLSQLLLKILHLLCITFGREFCIEVIHELFDQLNSDYDETIDVAIEGDTLISDFLNSLRLPFGSDIYNCISEATRMHQSKRPRFWANLFTLIQSDDCFEVDLNLAVENFTALVQEQENYFSIYHSLKIVEICLQNREKVCGPQHHLCIALVANYTRLIEDIEENDEMQVKLSIIMLSQDCIKLLGMAHQSNQHIICRALVESELKTSNGKSYVKTDEFDETSVNLLQENLDYGTSFNFKKVPLSASLRDSVRNKKRKMHVPIENKQFVFDAIRYCVGDNFQLLADLLVEIVTPDVMFNERTWPEDEFLKVTIERDLHITSKFEAHTLLWSLCELIAKGGALKYCLVLIRALIAVQMTQWNSATISKDRLKIDTTRRLICLIAKSELVPDIPFNQLHLALPYLDAYEVFCLMDDLWKFLKDSQVTFDTKESEIASVQFPPLKPYFERLRIIASEKFPGDLYVQFFHPIQSG